MQSQLLRYLMYWLRIMHHELYRLPEQPRDQVSCLQEVDPGAFQAFLADKWWTEEDKGGD